jgi:hypothetical protein
MKNILNIPNKINSFPNSSDLKKKFYHNYSILKELPRDERLEHPLFFENERIIHHLLGLVVE